MSEARLARVQQAEEPAIQLQKEWQEKLRLRRLYSVQPAPRIVKRARIRYRLAWDRIILVAVAAACVATFRSNAALEAQYRADARTAYSGLHLSR